MHFLRYRIIERTKQTKNYQPFLNSWLKRYHSCRHESHLKLLDIVCMKKLKNLCHIFTGIVLDLVDIKDKYRYAEFFFNWNLSIVNYLLPLIPPPPKKIYIICELLPPPPPPGLCTWPAAYKWRTTYSISWILPWNYYDLFGIIWLYV